MFWRFGGYANLSSLDSVLDKPDVTLEEVLDENDTISELKSQNAKLIDFLRDDSVLDRLLKFVIAPSTPVPTLVRPESPTVERSGGGFLVKAIRKGRSKSRSGHDEPEQEKQAKQRKKYAYVSCEILSSDVWSISESLFENTDQLKPFWDYLKSEAPLDNLQASYFTKVNEALIEKQPMRMVAFVKTLDNVVPNMMRHVDCPMIMDLLLKLISLEKEPGGQGIVDWIQAQDLIPILLSYITPNYPAATQTAAGDFLKAIITISANATGQDASVIGPNELTRQLVSEQCLNSLIGEMLKGGNPLTVGVGIIIEVIRKNNSDYDAETQIGPEPKTSDPIYLGSLLRIFANHVSDFMALILSPSHTVMTEKGSKHIVRKDMKVAWGEKIEPLGFDRFKTCELMAELLHCSNMGLLNEKGSETEIKQRDAERERLKDESRTASALAEKRKASADFGTSVDSSGFHHAQAFSPLGGSPDNIRRSEGQNSSEEDGFEKVALSEAMPESVVDDSDEILQGMEMSPPQQFSDNGSTPTSSDNDASTPTTTTEQALDDKFEDLSLDDETPTVISPLKPRPIEQESNMGLGPSSSNTTESTEVVDDQEFGDKPAPLFARRSVQSAATDEDTNSTFAAGTEVIEKEDLPSSPNHEDNAEPSAQNLPSIQREDDGSPVLGDLLKIRFVEHSVVPTILDFFFRFPWNNFLHNVVYDVVQQVFNGAMDRGYNCHVAIDLFGVGRITERVMEGQERSDKAQKEQKLRLGYMGHLTLIAEEIVKFTERQPQDTLAEEIMNKVLEPAWVQYVEHTLTETRDRDNAILGGVKPDNSVGPRQAVLNAVNAAQTGFGNNPSPGLANAGLTGSGTGLDSMDLINAGNTGYTLNNNTLLSGFGSSDDEDEDDIEEGQVSDISEHDIQQEQQDQEEQQANPDSGTDLPSIPPPLAVPPSRARRQLAARLADRKRQAETLSEESNDPSIAGAAVFAENLGPSYEAVDTGSTSRPLSPGVARKLRFEDDLTSSDVGEQYGGRKGRTKSGGSGGFSDHFKGFGADDTSSSSGSEEDEELGSIEAERVMLEQLREIVHPRSPIKRHPEDDDDEDAPQPGLERQSTRESLERRPLDLGDDSDDEGASDTPPLGTPSPSAASESATPVKEDTWSPEMQRKESELKKLEQDRMLAEWGLAGDDDDDDDDEEDEPVSMGQKYFTRKQSSG